MRAYIIPLLSAIVWIGVALLVAFPQQVYRFDLLALSNGFMSSDNFSRIFVPILIFTDIIIAVLVGHYKTSQMRFGCIVVTIVLYAIFAIAPELGSASIAEPLPSGDEKVMTESGNYLALFILLMIFLLLIRSVSFYDEDRNVKKQVKIDA